MVLHIATHKLPWATVGDLNMDPEEIEVSEWVQRLRAKIVVPPEPTCYGSGGTATLRGYMLLSQDLAACVEEPAINRKVVMATHEAVDFRVKPQKAWPKRSQSLRL